MFLMTPRPGASPMVGHTILQNCVNVLLEERRRGSNANMEAEERGSIEARSARVRIVRGPVETARAWPRAAVEATESKDFVVAVRAKPTAQ